MEGEGTVFAPALEGMKHVKSEEGEMLSKPFLDVCKQILPVIDNFGAAMTLVKTDVGGNITRLENKYLSNPAEFQNLFSMVRVEVEAKKANGSSSCTNGLLWLTRAMDFIVELFRNLMEHEDWAMSQVCTEAYTKTLKKYHGWLASSTFTMAMKLAPDRKKFMAVVGEKGDIKADIEKFCATFTPLLQDNHKFLASLGLDEMKAKFFYRIKGSRVEYNYRCIEYKPRRRTKIKKQNIQIGTPTDVKHVAHIGCDGSAQESPSWMRGFGPPASSDASEAPGDGPQWVSEDSGQRMCRRECHEKLKIKHHRHRSVENAPETDSQTKPRQPRRHHTRGTQGQCARDETLPEVPKRTRKKKPKDESKSKTDDISSQALAESDTEK